MVKFAHLADCHLGGWRLPELQELNFKSFQYALEVCKKEKVDFILIAGDLFDSAYPPIETIKETFNEFRKLKEEKIPVFLIAGSHDYSVTGKSFLDVLEKSGFITNVHKYEEKNNTIFLIPTIHNGTAIYGFPGKKSSYEIYDIAKIKLQDSPGLYKILMLHTTLSDAVPDLPIPSVDFKILPKVDYLALGHLHTKYEKENPRRVYGGPIFPMNSAELESLNCGAFYIIDTSGKIKRNEILLKEVLTLDIEIKDSIKGTDFIIEKLKEKYLKDKILILKIKGVLEKGRVSEIDFNKIELFAKSNGCYCFLKNTARLLLPNQELEFDDSVNPNLEEEILSEFIEKNPHKFNDLIHRLVNSLDFEKKEDETTRVFEDRLFSEINNLVNL